MASTFTMSILTPASSYFFRKAFTLSMDAAKFGIRLRQQAGSRHRSQRDFAESASSRIHAVSFRRGASNRLHTNAHGLTTRSRRDPLQYELMIALLRGVLIEKHPNQAIV